MKLKERLLTCELVYDNEYLNKYIELINKNLESQKVAGSQHHHIIPRFYFRDNKLEIDNSNDNIVNLSFADHVLAHYYLALCCKGSYKYKAELAFMRTSNYMTFPTLDVLMNDLDKYNELYESTVKHMSEYRMGHETSALTRQKISIANKGKRRTLEERKRIADATRAATTQEMREKNSAYHKGTIWVNDGEHSKQIRPENLQEMIDTGWSRGRLGFSKEALNNIRLGNIRIGKRVKGKIRYVNNGISQKVISINDVETFLKENIDWSLGQLPKPQYLGARFMTNGIINRRIKKNDFDFYLKHGWIFGRTNKKKDF